MPDLEFSLFLSKRVPGGLRPLPGSQGKSSPGAYPVGFSAQDGAKKASRTAQDGQDGVSCCHMVSNMAVDGPLWLPRCLQDGPNSLQDGPGDLQGASRRAPRGQNHWKTYGFSMIITIRPHTATVVPEVTPRAPWEPQDGPRSPQDGPRWPRDGPKMDPSHMSCDKPAVFSQLTL